MLPLTTVAAGVLWLSVVTTGDCCGDDWPRFRGANGSGISVLEGVPLQWTQDDYDWVIPLPGKGHSSPVVWGNRVYVASGDDDGQRMLICLDGDTGEQLWLRTLRLPGEHRLHLKNSHGSGTAATDGERVYASFADRDHYQVMAFDCQSGETVWSVDLGPLESQHGHGFSPILYQDRLIVTNDQMGPSFIVALDPKTGAEIWKTPRPSGSDSYCTPAVFELNGRPQLICISEAAGITGLDPLHGQQLWSTGPMPKRTLASAICGDGVLIASCGQAGRGVTMWAVEPPAASEDSLPRTRWERNRMLPYVPTPIIANDILYLWMDDGVVAAVDLKTNEDLERIRVGGTYSSSPVMINGVLYCPSEDGEIATVRTSPRLELIGKSPLGDRIHSTPAVANGRVYFRGFQTLSCLKATTSDSSATEQTDEPDE